MAKPLRKKGRRGPKTAEGKARALANLKPCKPGETHNAKGRPSAGATLREWINQLAAQGLTEDQLRRIARDKSEPWPRRAAAERIIRTLETGDLADLEPVLKGEKSLKQLRDEGINTEAVKKLSITRNGVTVELHDRAGVDYDRVSDTTEPRPRQELDVTSDGKEIKLLPIILDGDKEL